MNTGNHLAICGASVDINVILPNGASALFSKAFEPLAIVGYIEDKWLLVCNSAGMMSWFQLLPGNTSQSNILIMHDQCFECIATSNESFQFKLQNLKPLFTTEQISRILVSITGNLRNVKGNVVFDAASDPQSTEHHCSALPEEEWNFYSKLAISIIENNLPHVDERFVGIYALPVAPSEGEHENLEDFNSLSSWIADAIRANTGLRYSDALGAARITLDVLKLPESRGGRVANDDLHSFIGILSNAEKACRSCDRHSVTKSDDELKLMELLSQLVAWVEDAQRSSTWRSSSEDSELMNLLGDIRNILNDANPEKIILSLQAACPQALEAASALYKLEKNHEIRLSIRSLLVSWLLVARQYKGRNSMMQLFAAESCGGMVLAELFRELISAKDMTESSSESIISLAVMLLQTTRYFPPSDISYDLPQLFGAIVANASTHASVIAICIELTELLVQAHLSQKYEENESKRCSVNFTACLVSTTPEKANVESFIDAITQRYLLLTPDKYFASAGMSTHVDLINLLKFWAHILGDPKLLEHGLMHSSDLNVLIDWCNRQLESFEIDNSQPASLQDSYIYVKKLFVIATSVEFF